MRATRVICDELSNLMSEGADNLQQASQLIRLLIVQLVIEKRNI
jgi:hypothetical protein